MSVKQTLLEGFEPLKDKISRAVFSEEQLEKLDLVSAQTVTRKTTSDFSLSKLKECLKDVSTHYAMATAAQKQTPRNFGMEANREYFETGFLEPFRVISSEEATQLAAKSQEWHTQDFENDSLLTREIIEVLKKYKLWNLNYSGLFQVARNSTIREVLGSQAIVQNLRSILGEDIVLWRSQFFEKKPGSPGTFWHQTGTFKETSKFEKLKAHENVPPHLIQATTWIALTDSTPENGCLRLLPRSFVTNWMEYLFNMVNSDPIEIAAILDSEKAELLLKTFYLTGGNFEKAQFVVELLFEIFPEYLQDYQVIDLEMKKGEAVIFSSLNYHASYPNTSEDKYRLALAGRYTTPDVKVYENQTTDFFASPEGNLEFPLDEIKCVLMHGEDRYRYNNYL